MLLLTILLGIHSAFASVALPANPRALSRDPFSAYQWGLVNQKQVEVTGVDADDLRSKRITGVPGADLGADFDYDSLMKRDTVVAVIDTGVDLAHEDLQGAIALNPAECVDGRAPAFPKGDLDGNGFPGDCAGWNFNTNNNRMGDGSGHGTHLAGIIAARKDNGKGIRGISNRVKILPLAVMGGPNAGLTDRVLQAMRYAMARKVDVINLSLGWPYSEDSAALRDVFRQASAQGILIVAAAGNDGTREPVLPCAYDGVICVGGTDITGRMSESSNFGGQVDFLAPGEEILSTIPKNVLSTAFAVPGYDFLTGSSQSAAYISGVLGVLKGIYPAESPAALYYRLAKSARYPGGNANSSLHGIPSLKAALEVQPGVLVQPVLKQSSQLAFTLGATKLEFPLPLRNFGAAPASVALEVASESRTLGASFRASVRLAAGEDTTVSVPLALLDPHGDNHAVLAITINGVKFRHHLTLVRELTARDAKSWAIPGLTDKEIGQTVKDKFLANLSTLNDPAFRLGGSAYYYAQPVANGVDFALLRVTNGSLQLAGRTLVPGARLLGVYVSDINRDGQPDLMIYTEAQATGNAAGRDFSFYDLKLRPVFGKDKSTWHLELDPENDPAPSPAVFAYVPTALPGFGNVALPGQVMTGLLPAADLNLQPFADDTQRPAPHFFYYLPELKAGRVELKIRALDGKKFRDALAAKLKTSWSTDVRLLVAAGAPASLLLSVGSGAKFSAYQIDAADLAGWRSAALALKPVHGLDYSWAALNLADTKRVGATTANQYASALAQPFDQNRLRWGSWKPGTAQGKAVSFTLPHADDQLEKLAAVYWRESEGLTAYVLSRDYLEEHTVAKGRKPQVRQIPVSRFSYVPAELMNLLYFPFYAGRGTASSPAFYVNATALNQSYVYVIRTDGAELRNAADLTVQVPANCMALAPTYAGAEHQSVLSFVCRRAAGAELRQLPVTMAK